MLCSPYLPEEIDIPRDSWVFSTSTRKKGICIKKGDYIEELSLKSQYHGPVNLLNYYLTPVELGKAVTVFLQPY